jgi:hypothetical protein
VCTTIPISQLAVVAQFRQTNHKQQLRKIKHPHLRQIHAVGIVTQMGALFAYFLASGVHVFGSSTARASLATENAVLIVSNLNK